MKKYYNSVIKRTYNYFDSEIIACLLLRLDDTVQFNAVTHSTIGAYDKLDQTSTHMYLI